MKEGTENVSSFTRAAKLLFKTLSPDGSNLKKDNLENILQASETTSKLWKYLKRSGLIKMLQKGEEIGESDFLSMVANYEKGVLPTEHEFFEDDDDDYNGAKPEALDQAGKLLQKFLKSSANYVLDKVMKNGTTWLRNLVPTTQLQTLLLIMLYSFCTMEMLLIVLPLVLGTLAFCTMVINTLQAFAIRRLLDRFGIWSDILEEFGPDELDRKRAESLFNWNTVRWPVVSFSLATCVFTFSFSLVDSAWIPNSEFTVIAIYFTVSTHRWLDDSRDGVTTLSLLLVIASKLGSLSSTLSFLNRPLLTLEITPGLSVHFSFSSFLYFCSLALLIYIAARQCGEDIYRVFLPHLMSILWLRLGLYSAQSSTVVGLIRASVGWALLILLSPLALLFFALYFLKWFLLGTGFGFQILVTCLLIAVPTVAVMGVTNQLNSLRENKAKVFWAFLALVVVLGFFSSLSHLYYRRPSEIDLSFSQYQNLCGRQAAASLTEQTICHQLNGKVVGWKGVVSEAVKITRIENRAESVLQKLPQVLADQLRCIYGEPYPECHGALANQTDPLCAVKNHTGCSCHLQNYDIYTFSVTIGVVGQQREAKITDKEHENGDIGGYIVLVASHKCKGVLWDLKMGTQVEFSAKIKSLSAGLELVALHLVEVPDTLLSRVTDDDENSLSKRLIGSLYFTLNSFLSPLLSVHI